MITALLVEIAITLILAAILGLLVGKIKGLLSTLLATFIVDVLLIALTLTLYPTYLPLNHLPASIGKHPGHTPPYLINTTLVLEIALWTLPLAAAAGYLLGQIKGLLNTLALTALTILLCFAAAIAPYILRGITETTLYLVAMVFWIVPMGILLMANTLYEGINPLALIALWAEFSLSCWIGYGVAGRIGLLLITIPAQLVLWGALYWITRWMLPLKEGQQKSALRSLLAFDLGAHRPYYVTGDRHADFTQKPKPRVRGSATKSPFAGPGIVFNRRRYIALAGSGIDTQKYAPGLTFTDEQLAIETALDLRPQRITVEIDTATGEEDTANDSDLNVVASIIYRINEGKVEQLSATSSNGLQDACETVLKDRANQAFQALAANRDFDALRTPPADLAQDFESQLRNLLTPLGIEVLLCSLDQVAMPEAKIAKHIEKWKTDQAQSIEEIVKRTRQTARTDILNQLAHALQYAENHEVPPVQLSHQLMDILNIEVPETFEKHTESDESYLSRYLLRARRRSRPTAGTAMPKGSEARR